MKPRKSQVTTLTTYSQPQPTNKARPVAAKPEKLPTIKPKERRPKSRDVTDKTCAIMALLLAFVMVVTLCSWSYSCAW